MEIALLLDSMDLYRGPLVNTYLKTWGNPNNGQKSVLKKIESWTESNNQISLLYYGNEFCEYCLPTCDDLSKAISKCLEDGMKFVFVTPPVSDWGIKKVRGALEYLTQNGINAEVVVNDVGVLELIDQEFPNIQVIIGRVFDKLSHDSRICTEDMKEYYGTPGLNFARTPGILSNMAKQAFERFCIKRYEFDLPKVGIDLPNEGNFSLYWPYHYLTTGRVCMMRANYKKGKDKFTIGKTGCPRICKEIQVEMRKPVNGFRISNGKKITDVYLFQRGNTIFYLYEEEDFSNVAKQFNRLVLQV